MILSLVISSLYCIFAGAGIPDVKSILRHFKDAFDWEEAYQSGRVIPREGADVDYDAACQVVKDIESSLRKQLKEQQKFLGDSSVRISKLAWFFMTEHLA